MICTSIIASALGLLLVGNAVYVSNNRRCLLDTTRIDSVVMMRALGKNVEALAPGLVINATHPSPTRMRGCCSEALEHSFGLFDDVTDLMWKRIRRRTHSSSWYWNPGNPLERAEDVEWWNTHNMNPNFNCLHLEKVGGRDHESSKFLCNPRRLVHSSKSDCLIYSVGCAGNFKFEDAMYILHNKSCEIHVFDPANWERKGDKENKNIHYHAWGLVSTYDDKSKSVVWPKGRNGRFKTFPETLRELGHENRTIDIFKIDCEGCEWSTHKDWIHHDLRQILVEVHGVPHPNGTPKHRWYQQPMHMHNDFYKDFVDNGYALYYKDPNLPWGLELSFIKLDRGFWETVDDKELEYRSME